MATILRESFSASGDHTADHLILHRRFNADRLPIDYGVVGDGIANDTTALNEFFFARSGKFCYIPAGEYMIDAAIGLILHSGMTIEASKQAIFKAISNSLSNYTIVKADGVAGLTWRGGQIIGDSDRHIGETGRFGHGVSILGSYNVSVEDTLIHHCNGDGMSIGGDSVEVYLRGVRSSYNARMGLTIESATRCWVDMCWFSNQTIQAPAAGVTIETVAEHDASDICFSNSTFDNNGYYGLVIDGTQHTVSKVTIANCRASNNGRYGLAVGHASDVVIGNCTALLNTWRDVSVSASDAVIVKSCDLSAAVLINAGVTGYAEAGVIVR